MRANKRWTSWFLAVFTVIVLLTIGCTFVETCADGSSSCQSALKGLRLRFFVLALIAVFITMGLCAYAGDDGIANCMALRPSTAPSPIFLRFNQDIKLLLQQDSLSRPTVGYQAFLSYDTEMLAFTSAIYTSDPYNLHIIDPIAAAEGEIDLAAGIDPASQAPTSQPATLAELRFTSANKEGITNVSFRSSPRPSLFTDDQGNPLDTYLINSPMIVVDNTPPEIDSVQSIVVQNDPGQCQATVMVRGPTAQDNLSGIHSIVGVRSDNELPSAPFPIGTTTITWTATDRAGNSSQSEQVITVNDVEPPSITAPADVDVTADPLVDYAGAANVSLGNPQVSDNCEVVVTNDAPTRFVAGITTVTWTATDAGRNTATSTQKVTVFDNRPVIVVREDDCRATWKTPFFGLGGISGIEYGKLKRIPITWGAITDWMTTGNSGYSLKWADLQDYLAVAGGEVASHSCKHIALATTQDYIDALVNSKAAIEAALPGIKCTTFYQPGDWTGADNDAHLDRFSKLGSPIGMALQAAYEQSMAYLGSGWRIGDAYYRYGITNSYCIDYQAYPSIPALQSTLDIVAASPGTILTVSTHGIQETGGTTEYCVQANMLKAFFDRLEELRDAGKIRLMTAHDAYNAHFSPNINRFPDAGFEACSPGSLNLVGPWRLYGTTTVEAHGGVDDSRCIKITGAGSILEGSNLILPPGVYILNWSQKAGSGAPMTKPVYISMFSYRPSDPNPAQLIGYYQSYNTEVDTWQQKSCYAVVRECFPFAALYFSTQNQTNYFIDNVFLTKIDVDPNQSPANIAVNVNPNGYALAWTSPQDPSFTSISIRTDPKAHPFSSTDGKLVATLSATPGAQQTYSTNLNWSSNLQYYLSVFATKAGGYSSTPGLASVTVDKTPPSAPDVTSSYTGTFSANWQSIDNESSVYGYKYAVGTDPGSSNMLNWTQTSDTYAILPALPLNRTLYLSVMAQNCFGYWSQTTTVRMVSVITIPSALALPNGASVSLSGVISAVFGDCCYLEQKDSVRGIKLIGSILGLTEGSAVTISGSMTTLNGERAIYIQQPH